MNLQEWLLLGHILAAMIWVGALAAIGGLAVHVLRDPDRAASGRFVGSLRTIGPALLAPSSVLVVAFGIWLVADSEAWEFGQLWIWLALALYVVAFLIGVAHQARTAIAAERAAARGEHDEAARQLRRWAWGTCATVVLLVVAAWDMVFKPGL